MSYLKGYTLNNYLASSTITVLVSFKMSPNATAGKGFTIFLSANIGYLSGVGNLSTTYRFMGTIISPIQTNLVSLF